MTDASQPEPGIARGLATSRSQRISNIRYQLTFDIPPDPAAPIRGAVRLGFALTDTWTPVVIDFRGEVGGRIRVNDHDLADADDNDDTIGAISNGHIVIASRYLNRGDNRVELTFTPAAGPINRREGLVYSLFVPARAHLAFPCFDQPDLKAAFSLTLTVPAGWHALSNAAEVERGAAREGTQIIRFAETATISTFLFAFVAGDLQARTADIGGQAIELWHVASDRDAVRRNADRIVAQHAGALAWLEDYTAIPYPFGKFACVLIPAFQFGGMEHPGVIYYNAGSLLLEDAATENQQLAAAHLIAHETAHMWFGDLVTMPWFDDVWMKEVFANTMAAKIVNPQFPALDHDLRFLLSHYPAAYTVDRTAGTHPVRQELDNLDRAGSLYGPIVYQKAPIAMELLEQAIGAENMREALRAYLSRFAFGSASWPDLKDVLKAHTHLDISAWSAKYIESAGMPQVTASARFPPPAASELLDSMRARARDTFKLPDGTTVPLALRPQRVHALQPYGRPVLDAASKEMLPRDLLMPGVNAFHRGSSWIMAWEDTLAGDIDPAVFVTATLRALPREDVEQIVQLVVGYLKDAFWRLTDDAGRSAIAERLETTLFAAVTLRALDSPTLAATLFDALRATTTTATGVARLESLWRRDMLIAGLVISEEDSMRLAQDLAIRRPERADEIVSLELRRQAESSGGMQGERWQRLNFLIPALAAQQSTRDDFFARLLDVRNRARERWVVEGLRLLHHPLRVTAGLPYLRPSLDVLEEIEATGDIFLPKNWLDALLWGHRSAGAAQIVRAFLTARTDYPVRLRRLILQSADVLFRVNP